MNAISKFFKTKTHRLLMGVPVLSKNFKSNSKDPRNKAFLNVKISTVVLDRVFVT